MISDESYNNKYKSLLKDSRQRTNLESLHMVDKNKMDFW